MLIICWAIFKHFINMNSIFITTFQVDTIVTHILQMQTEAKRD